MTFCKRIKSELCFDAEKTCCRFAETYGMLLCSGVFFNDSFSFVTENEDVAIRLNENCKRLFNVKLITSCTGSKKDIYTVTAKLSDAEKIKNAFYGSEKTVIKEHNISDECCPAAFLRGVFLASGYMENPEKGYLVEFSLKDLTLAYELNLFLSKMGLPSKITNRKNYAVVYIKDSSVIEDFLTTVGLPQKTLELVDIKILKDIKNRENRAFNCTVANIDKTVNASVIQRRAITALKKCGMYDNLSAELKEAAELRMENPEASLTELLAISGQSITKSGLNHRLSKLVEKAKEKDLL